MLPIGEIVTNIETTCGLSKVEFLKESYNLTKIKEISNEPEFGSLLGAIMVKISVLAGIKSEIDQFVKQDIFKMILSTFKDLSFEEISKAFEMERYGLYNNKTEHYQLFDSNYISQVLKKYRKWKEGEMLHLNISPPRIESKITEHQKKQLREALLVNIFIDLTEKGFSPDSWEIYSELEVSDKINPTEEYRKKLYKEQLKIYEVEEKALIKSKYEPIIIKTHLQYLNDKITGKKVIESVSNKCRSIIASEFLKNHIENFENFKKIINETTP
jgi:hypothetical protein